MPMGRKLNPTTPATSPRVIEEMIRSLGWTYSMERDWRNLLPLSLFRKSFSSLTLLNFSTSFWWSSIFSLFFLASMNILNTKPMVTNITGITIIPMIISVLASI